MFLFLDFETYSEVDIKSCGADVYARDPSTRVLLTGWCLGGEDIHVDEGVPSYVFYDLITDMHTGADISLIAFNAPFELAILEHVCCTPVMPDRVRCAMAQSYALGFTGGLENVVKQWGFPEELWKNPEGKKLIHRFCKPQSKSFKVRNWNKNNDPEGWEKLVAYCKQDVNTLRALWYKNDEVLSRG